MLEELGYDDLDCCSLRARCHPGEPGFDPLLFKIYGYGGYGYDIGSWDDLKQVWPLTQFFSVSFL